MGAARLWDAAMYPRVYMTVEPILLVFMFAQFLSYSIFQQLLHFMVCENIPECKNQTLSFVDKSNGTVHGTCPVSSAVEKQVQAETSYWLLYVNLALGLPSIVFSLLYGSISDQMGRKLFIFLPAFGAILNTGIILEVVYLKDELPFYLFVIGGFTAGLYGSYPVLNFAVYSYLSDLTTHTTRTRHVGILESMTYLGATVSLLVGGLWVEGSRSFIPVFWCVLACQLLVIAYTLLGLPESMQFSRQSTGKGGTMSVYQRKYSRSHRLSTTCARFVKAIGGNLSGFLKLVATDWRVSLLILVYFVVEINFMGITDVVFLFALRDPLCWTMKLTGYFLAFKVFLNGLASLLVVPFLASCGVGDGVIILAGLLSGAVSLIVMGLATKTWIMFLVPVVAAMRGTVVPCLRSMLSKQVPADKQGIMYSSLSVIESTCTLLASVIYNILYPFTYSVHPGMCFFVMAAALSVPILLVIFLHVTRGYSSSCFQSRKRSRTITPVATPTSTVETKPLLQ